MRSKSRGTTVEGKIARCLLGDLRPGVTGRDVREGEEMDPRLAGDAGRVLGGRVIRLPRSVSLVGEERRLVDEDVGTLRPLPRRTASARCRR